MSEIPEFTGRSFDQVCFVVEDLNAAVDHWRRVNGIGDWDIVQDLAKYHTDKEYWEKPGIFSSVAPMAWWAAR